MIEQLTEVARGKCLHCKHKIVKYAGDLTGEQWYHDGDPGRRECPGSTYAEPTPDTTEETH